MEADDGPRLAADRAGRMEGTDALCPASLPLSRKSVPSWGDGVRGGWGKGGIWKAGGGGGELGPPRLGSAGTGCRLSTLPSVSLLSPPPFSLFLSPSFIHSKLKRRKQGPHSAHPQPLPDPLFSSPQLTTPYHHQAICALSSWLGHLLSLAFALISKRVQCFKNINTYIF